MLFGLDSAQYPTGIPTIEAGAVGCLLAWSIHVDPCWHIFVRLFLRMQARGFELHDAMVSLSRQVRQHK